MKQITGKYNCSFRDIFCVDTYDCIISQINNDLFSKITRPIDSVLTTPLQNISDGVEEGVKSSLITNILI